MLNRGFEVELVLAMKNLLNGKSLDDDELQVLNSASSDDKSKIFEKVISRMLYSNSEDNKSKLENFKSNLKLIRVFKANQEFSKEKDNLQKCYACGYNSELEKAFNTLLKGERLSSNQILALSVADELNLLDAFGYVYGFLLNEINEELSEEFYLSMYYLKSFKLIGTSNIGKSI